MKKHCIIIIAVLIGIGCSNSTEKSGNSKELNTAKTDSFFPVTSFIKGQMIILDSLPITPLLITAVKEKADSVWLQKSQLRQQLQPFLTPEINETNFTTYFKETKFNDQTLNAITFTYDPITVLPASIPIRHWDVYIDPQTGDVVKVYIVKSVKEGDQSTTEQLTWQAGKFAKISSFLNKPDGTMELLKDKMFKWDFR
ncbi:MAG: hypothetical protein JWP81_4954 [Ferruginibacter sp.]|nr:hypothetical protein [Ferruginibacter sp.]